VGVEESIEQAAAVIAERCGDLAPRVGLVLGSGLGPIADELEDAVQIPYGDLPGFPEPGIAGNAGRLGLGTIGGTPVAIMQGRAHYYEKGDADAMKIPIRTLRKIGCETLLLTNAAGSINPDAGPGSVMLLSDHISFTGVSPLFGEAGNQRFVDMSNAYDPALREQLRIAAEQVGIELHDGVYMWFCGPHFETPAEIRAAKIMGATAAGMSTVPDVILARHAGMRVAALSIITNLAAGLSATKLSHEQTIANAAIATDHVRALIVAFLKSYRP
jgi:purine-nucleoside phosphorylase